MCVCVCVGGGGGGQWGWVAGNVLGASELVAVSAPRPAPLLQPFSRCASRATCAQCQPGALLVLGEASCRPCELMLLGPEPQSTRYPSTAPSQAAVLATQVSRRPQPGQGAEECGGPSDISGWPSGHLWALGPLPQGPLGLLTLPPPKRPPPPLAGAGLGSTLRGFRAWRGVCAAAQGSCLCPSDLLRSGLALWGGASTLLANSNQITLAPVCAAASSPSVGCCRGVQDTWQVPRN